MKRVFRRFVGGPSTPVPPGTAWSITDEALAAIDETVASHIPERGGALLATRGSRIVVDFIVDPREGESVSYFQSEHLQRLVDQRLQARENQRYAGTLHSHPASFAEPSTQDHAAYAATLRDNPQMRDALFPIVVQAGRGHIESTTRFGTQHLVDLENGTFAGFTVTVGSDKVAVRPAPMHIVPLRADAERVCDYLMPKIGPIVRTSSTFEFVIAGNAFPAVTFHQGDRSVTAIFGAHYPLVGPTIVAAGDLVTPAWLASEDSGLQLGQVLRPHLKPVDEIIPEVDRDLFEARLSEHLPAGVTSRFLVVGAGSVGSNAAELLVRSGARHLTLLDFDVVAASNLSRTVYSSADVGHAKVHALAQRLRSIAPDLNINVINGAIQDIRLEVLGDIDIAVLAADDLAAEFWLGHHLYERGIKAVSIKMFAHGDAGEVIVVEPEAGTPCLHCLLGDAPTGRGEADYGTGRINGSPALGPDIVATVARGVKVALALGQANGPLRDWLAPLLSEHRTYFQQSNVADWEYILAVKRGEVSRPFDSMWVRSAGDPSCGVCGEHRTDASVSPRGPMIPDLPPPSISEVRA